MKKNSPAATVSDGVGRTIYRLLAKRHKRNGVFDIINNVDSIYPTILHFPYPKAGSTNSAVKVGYLPAAGSDNLDRDSRRSAKQLHSRMEFIPGSNELFIQQMNRPQNTNKVWIARIGSPTPQNIFTDTDAAWLDTNDNIQWLKDNTWFTWESERNGWRHLYRISRDGKEIQPVTKGDFDYISPVGTDLQKDWYILSLHRKTIPNVISTVPNFSERRSERLSPAGQPTASL